MIINGRKQQKNHNYSILPYAFIVRNIDNTQDDFLYFLSRHNDYLPRFSTNFILVKKINKRK